MDLNTSKLSAANKKLLVGGAVLLVAAGLQYQFNVVPMRASKQAEVPLAVELQHEVAETSSGTVIVQAPLPSTTPTKLAGPYIRTSMYAWTAQLGLNFSNGGPKTTSGSLMEKYGVKVELRNQPNLDKSKEEQIKFAERLSRGDANPAEGVNFVILMGDGAAQYLAGINKALSKLGPEYRAEIIGAVGYSGNKVSGEDSCMGPSEWQEDPTKAQGGLIAGYLRDGDWNLCLYWAQQNGIKNNPDETTWDPSAINWVSTDDHLKAAEAYISGYCEDRRVVRDGKFTNEPKKHVCIQGVATWTPGDVNISEKKGGLIKLISTKENAYQMPAVIVGIKKWDETHSKQVVSYLKAALEGGDQVKTYENALNRAGKASYAIYGDQDPAYWVKYYKGLVKKDRAGYPVPLGGSRAMNLGDNLVLFGLSEGTGEKGDMLYRASYEGFGNIAKQQYPALIPDFPPINEAVNTAFLQNLAEVTKVVSKPDLPEFEQTDAPISDVVAKRNWNIMFDTGKATFSPQALSTLDQLYQTLSVGRMSVDIEGHTDNQGNPAINEPLSAARAEAVKDYLTRKAPSMFPSSRVSAKGYGDAKPVADNSTPDGRAKNRRVTVIIGSR